MPRASASKVALPDVSRAALERLGRNLAVARRRRRIPQQLLADRMLVTRQTVQRLEAGDPSVNLGVLASALFVLGLSSRLSELVAPEADGPGMSEELQRLPRRVRPPIRDDLDF
jgi:transcriptional regulator with XRE-family HTH domain